MLRLTSKLFQFMAYCSFFERLGANRDFRV